LKGSGSNREMSSLTKQLNAEIEFWREMLDAKAAKHSDHARERMRHALTLAERKLLLLGQADGDKGTPNANWAALKLISTEEH